MSIPQCHYFRSKQSVALVIDGRCQGACKAKIGNFELTLAVVKQIRQLYVSVHDYSAGILQYLDVRASTKSERKKTKQLWLTNVSWFNSSNGSFLNLKYHTVVAMDVFHCGQQLPCKAFHFRLLE